MARTPIVDSWIVSRPPSHAATVDGASIGLWWLAAIRIGDVDAHLGPRERRVDVAALVAAGHQPAEQPLRLVRRRRGPSSIVVSDGAAS